LRCNKPLSYEQTDVAGTQGAAADGLGGGVGIVPVTGHDGGAAHDHFPRHAGCDRVAVGVGNGDPNGGLGEATEASMALSSRATAAASSSAESAEMVIGVSP